MADKQAIDNIYNWADNKRRGYFEKYQETGASSSLTTYERYDDICQICEVASKALEEEYMDRARRHTNQLSLIDSFLDQHSLAADKTYSVEEVVTLLRKMVI